MIAFRPLPLLTAATVPALALLIALGVWQLNRAEEKRALIAERQAIAGGDVFTDLYTPYCLLSSGWLGRRVEAPSALAGDEVRFYGARADGAFGWRILRLAPAPDCSCIANAGSPEAAACVRSDRSVAVETGFEPLSGGRSPAPPTLSLEAPPAPNAFTPQNDPERGQFYRFESGALARAFGVPPDQVEAGVWLPAATAGLPPALADMPPERHVGYALTWFGVAAALVGVYVVFHHRAGRLF